MSAYAFLCAFLLAGQAHYECLCNAAPLSRFSPPLQQRLHNANNVTVTSHTVRASVAPIANYSLSTTPLVTGCGRSGTLSMHAMLSSVGIDAKHEDYKPGAISVSWVYGAITPQSRIAPVPFEAKSSLKARRAHLSHFAPVVLLVRHPLHVIASTQRCFCGGGSRKTPKGNVNDARSWRFVEHNINLQRFLGADLNPYQNLITWDDLPRDDIRRSMVYWVGWNALILDRHDVAGIVRIEDIDGPVLTARLLELPSNASSLLKYCYKDRAAANANIHKSASSTKRRFQNVTWRMLYRAAPLLSEKIWHMSQRFGYHVDDPPTLVQYLQLH